MVEGGRGVLMCESVVGLGHIPKNIEMILLSTTIYKKNSVEEATGGTHHPLSSLHYRSSSNRKPPKSLPSGQK